MLAVNSIPDSTIVAMLADNDINAWEQLYDKYAPMMYGAISKITRDERLAENIFRECFLQLKVNRNILKIRVDLCTFLLKHTHNFTFNYLNEMGLMYDNGKINYNDPLMQLLSSRQITFKAADVAGNPQLEARKKLREEFNRLRSQNKNGLC
jgi:hypothetical protein